MALSHHEALVRARAFLAADPSHWTQRAMARSADGLPRLTTEPGVTCACAQGAHRIVEGPTYDPGLAEDRDEILDDAAAELWPELGATAPPVNDGVIVIPGMTPYEAVLAIYDRAIENNPA